jgi:putative addiction module CopG family antidote
MTVSLTSEQEALIKEHLSTGRYTSEHEVIGEALALLKQHEKTLEKLRADIKEGLEDLAQGRYTTYTDETLGDFFEDVKKRGRERLAAKK